MDKKLESVLKKLRKLQALYEGAKSINSEGEANNAAAAIQRLLTQYNLTLDEIQEEEEREGVIEEEVNGFSYKSIGGRWESYLVFVICKWNFCKSFNIGTSYKRILIFGERENVEMVKWLRSFLSEKFVKLSSERFKEFKETEEFKRKPISKDKFQRSYLMGCVTGLEIKLKEESDREKKENESFGAKLNALVVRNGAAIDTYVAEKYKTGTGRASKTNYDSAWESGVTDGKNTSIHKQVSTTVNNSDIKVLK